MGTWVIENKTKILNLLGLRKSRHRISLWICTQPTISYPYKKQQRKQQQRNQVETNKQTNKLTFKTPRLTAKLSLLKRVFLHENYNNFHINIFALSFALKQRLMTLLRVELCRCCIELHCGGGLGTRSLLSFGTLKSSDETATRTSL